MDLANSQNFKSTKFTLTDQVNNEFTPKSFHKVIKNAIGDNLKGIKHEGSEVFVFTENDLSISNVNALNSIISNYTADLDSITYVMNDKIYINKRDVYRKPNHRGLHEEKIIDKYGDPSVINMYKTYNEETNAYSDLAVKEERQYLRAPSSGLVYKTISTIKYYLKSGDVGYVHEISRYYTKYRGDQRNQKSRANLVTKARMYLYEQIIIDATIANNGNQVAGFVQGDTDAKAFLIEIEDLQLISKYIGGVKQPLLDFISTSNNSHHYITQNIVDGTMNILNVEHG